MIDVMIDLETLGTTSDAPIVAIGAVVFDLASGKQGQEFYARIDWDSAIKGRRVSGATLKWWMKQDEGARLEIIKNGSSMQLALEDFTKFLKGACKNKNSDMYVWGNGSSFDISMLDHVFTQYKMPSPWLFYKVNDCRTVERMAEGIVDRRDFKFDGDKHNAVADARHQATYISAMWNALHNGTTTLPGEEGGEPDEDLFG